MTFRCWLFGHAKPTVREYREIDKVKVLHLVCPRCGDAEPAIQRTRQERIDQLKKYRRIAAPKAQREEAKRRPKVVGIDERRSER